MRQGVRVPRPTDVANFGCLRHLQRAAVAYPGGTLQPPPSEMSIFVQVTLCIELRIRG